MERAHDLSGLIGEAEAGMERAHELSALTSGGRRWDAALCGEQTAPRAADPVWSPLRFSRFHVGQSEESVTNCHGRGRGAQ